MRLRNIPEAKDIVASSPYVIKNPEERRGKWKQAGRPLCLEIGTGKGRFIIEMALAHPEADFLGMERYESVLLRACERMEGKPYRTPMDKLEYAKAAEIRCVSGGDETTAASAISRCREHDRSDTNPAQSEHRETGNVSESSASTQRIAESMDENALPVPGNLHFLNNDAREITDIFAPGELDKIYLNFSDPWPKARHAKRRLTSHEFLHLYEQCLKDGGCLEFKTDNTALFDFSIQEIKNAPNWELTGLTRDLHRDPVLGAGNIMTEYERKFSALGNKICKLTAVYRAPENPGAVTPRFS